MLLGLSGKMGCGKSTLANLVCEQVPGSVVLSFATALRQEVAGVLGLSVPEVRAPEFKSRPFTIGTWSMTGRQVLQWWGTNVRRDADPEYWDKRAMHAYEEAVASGAKLVIFDDVRFPSEVAAIYRAGGMVVRVEPYAGWVPGEFADHESETALDGHAEFFARVRPAFGGLGVIADKLASMAKGEAR